jgi:hypothetical protein
VDIISILLLVERHQLWSDHMPRGVGVRLVMTEVAGIPDDNILAVNGFAIDELVKAGARQR